MRKIIITILTVLITLTLSYAQRATYFGLEVGPKFEVYQYADNGGYIYTKPFLATPVYGFNIGQEINKTFLVETCLYFVDYSQSYRKKNEQGYSTTNAIFVCQIPIRLKAHLPLLRDRLMLTTTVGYSQNINFNYASGGWGKESYIDNKDTITVIDSTDCGLRKTYPLLETALALEYKLKNDLIFYFAGAYFIGLKRVINIDIHYNINNGPDQTATVFSKGDYFSFVFGVKYPISNLWINKKKKSPQK